GCEADLSNDPKNCGRCSNNCFNTVGDTANPFCNAGSCEIASCLGRRADCDANPVNGGEVDLASDSCGDAIDAGSKAAESECGILCTVTTAKSQFFTSSGRGSKFFKARAVDAIGICSEPLVHEIFLDVPPGADYDLIVRPECGGNVEWSSTNSGLGVDETVE